MKRKVEEADTSSGSAGDQPSTSQQAEQWQWSHQDMDNMASHVGLNNNQCLKAAEFIRAKNNSKESVHKIF